VADGLPAAGSVLCIGGPLLAARAGSPAEACDNPACRAITAAYGPLFVHAQLNPATHESLHELYGPAPDPAAAPPTTGVRVPVSILYGAADPRVPAGGEADLVAGYGHVDLLIGRNAAQEVFPRVVAHLRRARATRAPAPG
jgi:hypothetical protein